MTSQLPPGYKCCDYDDPFENLVGPLGYKVDDGSLSFVFEAGAHHCNAQEIIHGGMLMTFADYVLCLTARWDYPDEQSLTVSFNCEFVESGRLGDLVVSRGEVIRRTGSFVFLRGQVLVDKRILLNYSGIVKRLRAVS
jgi:acyl-coenzyme A thioesterase PaaI-like protein